MKRLIAIILLYLTVVCPVSAIKTDIPNFDEIYKTATEQNNAEAQYTLGVMYDKGVGVEQDYTKAKKWYEKAAQQNFPLAQYSLGMIYYAGQGIEKDKNKAKEYFKLSCDNGIQDGCIVYKNIK